MEAWRSILASALDCPVIWRSEEQVTPAVGAARLARLAVTREDASEVCGAPAIRAITEPNPELRERYARQLPRFRRLYTRLRSEFTVSPE